jgi:phosphate-selective porin OprO/OprP
VRSRWVLAVAVLVMGSEAASGESYDLLRGDDYELDASTRRGLRFEVDEPEIDLRLGGQLAWDAAWFAADGTPMSADNEIRRGRVYLEGDLLDDWSFKIEREFAPDREGWRNLWLGYEPTSKLAFRAGNFVAPFGLEEVSSSRHSTFLERALPSAFAPSYQTGLGIRIGGRLGRDREENRWTWATAGYVEPLGDSEEDPHQSDHWGVASRVTFAPLAEKRRLVHLGLAVDYQRMEGSSRYGISSRPESALAPTLLNTGSLSDVDDVLSVGTEAATVLGPFSAQGEYMQSTLLRSGRDGAGNARHDATFDGWYVQASYVLTGERRRYSRSTGTFQGVKPKRKWGAVEIAVRYSTLDLDDTSVSGGEAKDWTVGLNWYLRENVRLMFDYTHVDATNSDLERDDPQIFGLRALVAF